MSDSGIRRPLLGGGERLVAEDLKRASGGGPKTPPYSLEEMHRALTPLAENLNTQLGALPQELRGEHVVFEATLHPNYLASSHFPAALLANRDLYVVGARSARAVHKTKKKETPDQPTKTLIVAGAPASISHLTSEIIEGPEAHKKDWEDIRKFRELGLPPSERVIRGRPRDVGAGEVVTWEAVLNPVGLPGVQRQRWADECFAKFVAWINRIGGEVDTGYRRIIKDLTFVPIALNAEEIEKAAQFNLLRAVRPMPTVRPIPTSVTRAATARSKMSSGPPTSSTTVAVFDGGIDPFNMALATHADLIDLSPEQPQADLVDHGSLVTSAVLYGPLDGPDLPRARCRVEHYRVLPLPSTADFDDQLYWLLDQIKARVEERSPSIVNLSLGPNEVVDDSDEPTRWSVELDELATTQNVLFVNAAGNNGEEDAALGFNRVQVPSDMANGVSVGATAVRDGRGRLKRAVYSAVGPGRPGQVVQPTGVAFGGELPHTPFVGIDSHGRLGESQGTSFSAPTTAGSFAVLRHLLGEERRDAALIRVFGVHFAEKAKRGHKTLEIGNGRFLDSYVGAFECAPNVVTVLYEVQLQRSELVGLTYPLPSTLAPETRLEMRWTLGYFSSVDPKDSTDYTLSGLEVSFRPHSKIYTLSNSETKKKIRDVNVSLEADLVQSMLEDGVATLSEHPVADSAWRKRRDEIRLRESGKWETIIGGRIPAREVVRFDAPRLDVNYLLREGGQLQAATPSELPIFMLLTMEAAEGVQLYDLVATEYPVLTPVTVQAQVEVA